MNNNNRGIFIKMTIINCNKSSNNINFKGLLITINQVRKYSFWKVIIFKPNWNKIRRSINKLENIRYRIHQDREMWKMRENN